MLQPGKMAYLGEFFCEVNGLKRWRFAQLQSGYSISNLTECYTISPILWIQFYTDLFFPAFILLYFQVRKMLQ